MTAPPILAYPKTMRKMFPAALLALPLALLLTPPPAAGHLGEPTIKGIRFPATRAGETWLIIDNVGLLVRADGRWRWLCDEAMTPTPGFNDIAPLDATGQTWLAATRSGLYRTIDAGCAFERVPIAGPDVFDLISPHPERPGEALVASESIGEVQNDVFYTTDAGARWQPAGVATTGRIRGLLRATADPDVVYVVHTDGAARSEDGGRTFTPISLAPPPDDPEARPVTGVDITLLATDPHDPLTVWSAFLRFPKSDLQRSRDGGVTWEIVAQFGDSPESLTIDAATGDMALAMPIDGLRRSTDGGATWTPLFLPAPGAWFDCLTRAPDGDLWACVRRGAPYLLAQSPDDGEGWMGRFAADYTDIDGPWLCPPDSATARACAAACDRSRQDCSAADGGAPLDAATDLGVTDADPPGDGDPPDVPVRRDAGDCAATPAAPGSKLPLLALVALLAVGRGRRR